jgi:hypothetical protein
VAGVTFDPSAVAARAHRATEMIHAMIYFVPEGDEELTAAGLRPGRMCYFASRSAPMGAVSAAVTTATFYNFNPETVAKTIPRAWTLADPATVITARFRAADRAMRRLLGDDGVASPEVAELAALAREATTVFELEARPLYAGHAGIDWPAEAHLQLWHAASLLREYRGDGHLIALLRHDLNGIDAILSHCATGKGFTEDAARLLRGWSEEQWEESRMRLRERGVLDASGRALTEDGQTLRAVVEAETDALDTAAWRHLGEQRTTRLMDLGKGVSRALLAAGALPASGVFAAPPT